MSTSCMACRTQVAMASNSSCKSSFSGLAEDLSRSRLHTSARSWICNGVASPAGPVSFRLSSSSSRIVPGFCEYSCSTRVMNHVTCVSWISADIRAARNLAVSPAPAILPTASRIHAFWVSIAVTCAISLFSSSSAKSSDCCARSLASALFPSAHALASSISDSKSLRSISKRFLACFCRSAAAVALACCSSLSSAAFVALFWRSASAFVRSSRIEASSLRK
mmetsp:Transcript_58973/g.158799  ORF Transcript_58973/g.158799 Transcript_58973/m.158799 type:complete len:222 (-) Transcript_58973:42-707(-)